jgi:phosphatidylglycerophosphatase C
MGSTKARRQPSKDFGANGEKCVVAFDFDGTLTICDTFTDFLRWRAGPVGWLIGLVRLIPESCLWVFHRDRGRIKSAAARVYLGGVDETVLAQDAARFAELKWARMMRPDALACWREWGEKGVHRVIVTASPAITVAPFARQLGAENLLGTTMEFDSDNKVTGTFVGPNCRGPEKVRRLKVAYGDDVTIIAAYGDTSGDHAMLAAADLTGYQVFREKPKRA